MSTSGHSIAEGDYSRLTLRDLATRIDQHLSRFERSPDLNPPRGKEKLKDYWRAGAIQLKRGVLESDA